MTALSQYHIYGNDIYTYPKSRAGPTQMIPLQPTQAHCVEGFWMPVSPSEPSQRLLGAIFTFKTALGALKLKSCMRYWSLKFQLRLDYFWFSFKKGMAPILTNQGAPFSFGFNPFPSAFLLLSDLHVSGPKIRFPGALSVFIC